MDEKKLRFEDGIYGFEEIKDYVLLQEDEEGIIWCLQAAGESVPALVVLNPFPFVPEYAPVLSAQDLLSLGNPAQEDLCILTVAVVKDPFEETAVNLKSPIVINVRNRQGCQVILDNSNYPIRFKPFEKKV